MAEKMSKMFWMCTKGVYMLTEIKRPGLNTATELDLKNATPVRKAQSPSYSTSFQLYALISTC